MKQLARVRDNPFLRFLVVGGFAAAANFGSRFVFSLGVSYETAVTLAWCVGITTAFTLSRLYVFEGARHGSVWRQFAGFTLVNLFALLQTLAVSLGLLHWGLPALGIERHAEAIAHAFGIVVPIFTSYFGHKHLSFRQPAL